MTTTLSDTHLNRKAQFTGLLDRICEALDLTPTQFQMAEGRYTSVAEWLANSEQTPLQSATIYPQGSFCLGTSVKPVERNEFDVDLVCFLPGFSPSVSPAFVKRLIGERLLANGHYREIVEEKPRCWRINYANEFHLDITPSIPNPMCTMGGELVPDKQLSCWKASNPKGYRDLFQRIAALRARVLLRVAAYEKRAQIEEFPEASQFKGVLRRSVQLCKRHRDIWFRERNPDLAPISIIITTLTAKSYAHCVNQGAYETEYDLFLEVLRQMPRFVEISTANGRRVYSVWNETTSGENFAEKWNQDHRRADAFFQWQQQAVNDFEGLTQLEGLDKISEGLSRTLGQGPVLGVMNYLTNTVTSARFDGRLSVGPAIGLNLSAIGTPVRRNTFYGKLE